jgi:hypothetical protein
LLGLFYPLDLFFPLPLCLRSRVSAVFSATTAFGIPVEIAALLPPSNWSHKRVAKIVFSMSGALYVRPLEITAATTGALLANCG